MTFSEVYNSKHSKAIIAFCQYLRILPGEAQKWLAMLHLPV